MADNPKEPYGSGIPYADPGFQKDGKKRYPIDTKEHAKAAWNYINKKKNAAEYSTSELSHIKGKIKAACKKFGIEISDDEKSMVDSGRNINAVNLNSKSYMSKRQKFNPMRLNAELEAFDAAINPLLEAAKINVIKINGVDVPASEAPAADRVSALAAVSSAGGGTQDLSDLTVANDRLSKENDEATGKLAVANSSIRKLQGDVTDLTTKLQASQASVSTLTAEKAELQNRHDAAISQVSTLTRDFNSINREISELCINCDVLDLKLSKTATKDEKISAANAVPASDKLKAYSGAFNVAMQRAGLDSKTLPMATAGQLQNPEIKGHDRMRAATKINGIPASKQ